MNAPEQTELVLTCEHAGCRIPAEYRALFAVAKKVLASHRGWDPGALTLARAMASSLKAPLHVVMWSRLLVEANRSISHPALWSIYTRNLDRAERDRILDRYWRPHREQVERDIAARIARGVRVVHVAVHSFTPVLHGVRRNADLGLLYDPARRREQTFCLVWQKSLAGIEPQLRVRRNYPYRGASDGLTTALRRQFPADRYLGIEIEMNQAFANRPSQAKWARALCRTLRALVAANL